MVSKGFVKYLGTCTHELCSRVCIFAIKRWSRTSPNKYLTNINETRQSVAVQREGGIPVGNKILHLIRTFELILQGQPRSNVMVQL